jgi:CRP/FNR family transcriptional regulator, cyclic AMP receptor protein
VYTGSAMVTAHELTDISIFSGLDPQTLADVARQMERREYRSGEFIVLEGEAPPGLFFVRGGRVRLSRTSPDGREQVLTMVGAGQNFSAVALFDDQPNPETARAMTAVQCLVLPAGPLHVLIARRPAVAVALLREFSSQLRELMLLVDDLAFRSVRERLARQLLREASAGHAELTQQELAERAGTVREIAGRVLRQLAQEGLVRLERGRVIVLDRARLAEVVEN